MGRRAIRLRTSGGHRTPGRDRDGATSVARTALQLDETGVNGSSFHAQNARIRHDERGSRPVQIPPRAQTPGVEPFSGDSLLRAAALSLRIYLTFVKGLRASRLLSVHAARRSNSLG